MANPVKKSSAVVIVTLDGKHLCNQCQYRDFAHLEDAVQSPVARHQCSINSVHPVRRAGAVVLCDGFAMKRGAA